MLIKHIDRYGDEDMSYRQLMSDIKNNCIKPVYLIYGSETFLIDKGRAALKNSVVTSFPELNYTYLGGEKLEADELSAACRTFPFGTEKRLVEVRDLGILKSKGGSRDEDKDEKDNASAPGKDAKPFIDVVQNLDDTTCLLFFSYGSINKKRKKFLDEVKKHGAVFEFNRIERAELALWIKKVLGKSGINIGPRELDHFINSIGYLDKNGSKTLYDVENEIKMLPVSVISSTESELLFIDCRKLAAPCSKACDFHSRLIQNMLNIISKKNVSLTQKIEFLSKRTTREKLLAYLSAEAKKAGSNRFSISFNRQELADYLFVERSAMSAELSKLRDDGILKYHKNQFELMVPTC
jgi:DNA-binding transcriptional ArsR family regulator